MIYAEPTLPSPSFSSSIIERQKRTLLRAFWIIATTLIGYELFWATPDPSLDSIVASLVTGVALLPSYLWCSNRAQGMPIFPFFALSHIWTHALPLATNHPSLTPYLPEDRLFAGLTVTGFLLLGTWVWFRLVKYPPVPPASYRMLHPKRGDRFFFSILIVSIVFTVANTGGWLFLSGGIFAAVRNAILGLTALATFILSYRLGAQELSRSQSRLFIVLVVTYIVISPINLLLIGAASTFLSAAIAYTIGSRKVPILPIVIMLACFTFLHYGKSEMRGKYWFGAEQGTYIQPWEYPARYSEWIGYSLDYLSQKDELPESEEKASFTERSSVIQMLLLAQTKSPDIVPFMNGETYAILPQVLIPRVLNPNKIASHEGTYLLSIHYGLQDRESTRKTTIGWGLLAESYANFGLLGCAGLAVVLGTAYGKVTRWCINAPILSAQSLFSVLLMTFAFQSEWSASVYVASLFQASVVIGGIVVVLMKSYPTTPYNTLTYPT